MFHHNGGFCATDCCDERTLLAMAVLVGEKGEQVFLVHTFVYAQFLAHVLRQQHPVACMRQLIPLTITAQMLFVVFLKSRSVDLKVSLQRADRYRVCVRIFFLRHQRTP